MVGKYDGCHSSKKVAPTAVGTKAMTLGVLGMELLPADSPSPVPSTRRGQSPECEGVKLYETCDGKCSECVSIIFYLGIARDEVPVPLPTPVKGFMYWHAKGIAGPSPTLLRMSECSCTRNTLLGSFDKP